MVKQAELSAMFILALLILSSFSCTTKVFAWNWQAQAPSQYTLTVSSAHGSPNPSVGSHNYDSGTSVTCTVASPVTEGGVIYACTGWSGTGSVQSSGGGTSTTFSITQDSSITWNWQAADFSVDASPVSATVVQGQSATYTVNVYSNIVGFSQSVSLSIRGLPTGTTGTFNPYTVIPTAPGKSTLTVTTTGAAQAGTYTLTITGAGGGITHEASVVLTINYETTTQRVVLAELFTATWCEFCPYATRAINELADEYGSSSLVVIQYHPNDGVDPFGNNETEARMSYYNVTAYPTMMFDGTISTVGGWTGAYDSYDATIQSELQQPSDVSISLGGNLTDFTANVTASSSIQSTPAEVRFVVYEDDIPYNAPNGETLFRFTVRTILNDQPITLSPGQTISIQRAFQPQAGWNLNNLGLVVFVQNDETHEVLQAAAFQKPTAFSFTCPNTVETVQPNETASFGAKLTNTGTLGDSYNLTLTNSLPAGWTAEFCNGTWCCLHSTIIAIQAGASQNITVDVLTSNTRGSGNVTLDVTSQNDPALTCSIIFDATVGGLVGYWNFNEGSGGKVGDSSGSDNSGTLSSYQDALLPQWADGFNGTSALKFDGNNDFVLVPDSSSLDLSSAVTLTAWVYLPAGAHYEDSRIVGKDASNGGTNLYLGIHNDSGNIVVGLGTDGGFSGEAINVYSVGVVPRNAWTNVAMTYDGSLIKIYINGTLDSSYSWTGGFTTNNGMPLCIGAKNYQGAAGGSQYGFCINGTLDDIRIYNTALSQQDVHNLITIPGDINGDGKVGLADLVILALAYGSHCANYDYQGEPASPNWNPNADILGQGVIRLADLVILAQHYGQHS